MRIRTNGLSAESARLAREHARQQVSRVLGRAARGVRQLSVRVGDLNGPRGGRDKFCSIDLTLLSGQQLRVRSRRATLAAAVADASRRMRRLVRRVLRRRVTLRRDSA